MPARTASRIIEEVSQRRGASRSAIARPQTILGFVAKDTEKLIRQLSLISFLMAQGRPVSALEIKREVEGYSDMNDDAFARRFYADRVELESLGIQLGVEKPGEGFFEAELYSLPPENFYLDAISFDDAELAALSTALLLLTDGGFAYAEPLRLALQQVAWGHPNPLAEGERAPVEMAMTASAGGRDLSQRLSKIETAISRRKTIEFTYFTMERGETEKRKVDPYHLVFRGGQFYLIGLSHEREAVRVFRLSRIQGKVGYATKAEHDFSPPEDFDRRDYGSRADWQLGGTQGTAKIWVKERIARLIERDFGTYGAIRDAKASDKAPGKGKIFETDYASHRELIAWVLRWRANAQVLAPDDLREENEARLATLRDRHKNGFKPADVVDRPLRDAPRRSRSGGRGGAGTPPRALPPPRHPRRDADRSGESGRAPADRRPAQTARADRGRAARGHRAAERRQLPGRHLRALRRNPRRRDRGRLGALRRQLRPPGPPAAARGEGAGRRYPPLRRPPAAVEPGEGARENRQSARPRPIGGGPRDRPRRRWRRQRGAPPEPGDRRFP